MPLLRLNTEINEIGSSFLCSLNQIHIEFRKYFAVFFCTRFLCLSLSLILSRSGSHFEAIVEQRGGERERDRNPREMKDLHNLPTDLVADFSETTFMIVQCSVLTVLVCFKFPAGCCSHGLNVYHNYSYCSVFVVCLNMVSSGSFFWLAFYRAHIHFVFR